MKSLLINVYYLEINVIFVNLTTIGVGSKSWLGVNYNCTILPLVQLHNEINTG